MSPGRAGSLCRNNKTIVDVYLDDNNITDPFARQILLYSPQMSRVTGHWRATSCHVDSVQLSASKIRASQLSSKPSMELEVVQNLKAGLFLPQQGANHISCCVLQLLDVGVLWWSSGDGHRCAEPLEGAATRAVNDAVNEDGFTLRLESSSSRGVVGELFEPLGPTRQSRPETGC